MNIAIDIDGVLTDLEKFAINNATKYCVENDIEYKIETKKADFVDSVAYLLNIPLETAKCFWQEYSKYYFTEYPIREFAIDVINKLKENNKIFIVTARNDWGLCDELKGKMKETTQNWLSSKQVYYDELIFSEKKLEACKENNIDLIIEDSPKNIENLKNSVKVLCFDAMYNRDLTEGNITRVYSWYDILLNINS